MRSTHTSDREVAARRGWGWRLFVGAPLHLLRAFACLATVCWFIVALFSVLADVPELPLRAWPLMILFFVCGWVFFFELFLGCGELIRRQAV